MVSRRNINRKVKKNSYFPADGSGFMLPIHWWVGRKGEFGLVEMSGSGKG